MKKRQPICLCLITLLLSTMMINVFSVSSLSLKEKSISSAKTDIDCKTLEKRIDSEKEIYTIPTTDGSQIMLTNYEGSRTPSVLLIHGMGGNHLMLDYDQNHSLAQYLADAGWDVWLLDLRTHDGDGDYFCDPASDREYINRYWDFDNTLLKIDVVTAVDFIKNQTHEKQIVLGGHSYGGYLAYAYAMLIGEENLSGIITTGAAPFAMPEDVYINFTSPHPLLYLARFGFFVGQRAFVNPVGFPCSFSLPKCYLNMYLKNYAPNKLVFYNYTTPRYVQLGLIHCGDNEPAGVMVDMFMGGHPTQYNGHWVDPQTLYDYSAHLKDITVPILFIAGEEDPQDPADDIYKAYTIVSSTEKTFYSFPKHSHLDLLLGDDVDELIFPKITGWLKKRENKR